MNASKEHSEEMEGQNTSSADAGTGAGSKPANRAPDIDQSGISMAAMSSAMVDPLGARVWAPLPLAFNPLLYSHLGKKTLYRKGKWTEEEEAFTKALISAFNDGLLSIPAGTTLRSFLSDKLNW